MNSVCHPLPLPVAQEMLQVLAQSLCARPGDRAATREARTRQMVHTVLGFEPRDGLEYMLSGLAFGHFHLILDSMRDALRGELDTIKAKTKTTVVSLDRSMLSLVKEFWVTRVTGAKLLASPSFRLVGSVPEGIGRAVGSRRAPAP